MHHISKNWECVFDFQYKVVTGQCVFVLFRTMIALMLQMFGEDFSQTQRMIADKAKFEFAAIFQLIGSAVTSAKIKT